MPTIQTARPTLPALKSPFVAAAGAPPAAPQASGDVVQLSGRTDAPATPPGRAPGAPAKATWTILVYSAGDNSLRSYLEQNLVDCQKVGSSNSMNVVSQFDQGGSAGCSRYYITKSAKPGLSSPVVGKLGQVDMADPKTLSDFIQWGEKNYPADHYMLVISDHGDGPKGAVEDDSAGTWMDLPKIQQGLQMAQDATHRKLDILGFDACLMGNDEVITQLKNNCDYMVGSEETEGGAGWPYTRILSPVMLKSLNEALLLKADTTAKDFAGEIVQDATNDQGDLPTLSAFDMSEVDQLTGAVKGLADAIKATATSPDTIRNIANDTQKFYDTSDLYDFADRPNKSGDIQDNTLNQAAQGVMDSIKNTVYAEQHSTTQYPNAHGVTVSLGTDAAPDDYYRGLDMPKQTGWASAIDKWQNLGNH